MYGLLKSTSGEMYQTNCFENYIFMKAASHASNATNGSLTLQNFTDHLPPMTQWTASSVLSLITFLTGFVGNGGLLILFAKNRTLRLPFNIYVVNLLIANMCCIIIQYPMDVVAQLHSSVWVMGESACTAYIYATWVLQAAIFNSHLLISTNRIWAIVHPHSYRRLHSARTAILLSVGVWVYVHIIVGPGLIIDAVFYRLPVNTDGCLFNSTAQRSWDLTIQVLCYNWPHFVVLMSLPIICFAKSKQHRKISIIVNAVERNKTQPAYPNASGLRCTRFFGSRPMSWRASLREDSHLDTAVDITPTVPRDSEQLKELATATENPVRSKKRRHNAHGYLLLVLLTVTVTVCWTPIDVYFLLAIFIKDLEMPTYWQLATILFSLQTTLDPIIFTLALKRLRHALRASFPQAPAKE